MELQAEGSRCIAKGIAFEANQNAYLQNVNPAESAGTCGVCAMQCNELSLDRVSS